MQTLKMFSIRDIKGEIFNPPFFSRSHGDAERNFTQAARDPKTTISQFPQDYDLYYIGEYDDASGRVIQTDPPKLIMNAVTAVSSN